MTRSGSLSVATAFVSFSFFGAPAALAGPAPAAAPPAAAAMKLDIKSAAGKPMSGNPTNGAKIFRQCMTCHSPKAGVNMVGPSLHGIIGRKASSIPNFRYSAANKKSGITWTEQELFVYLENPQKRVPGTLMAFAGVKDPQQRADVISYLKIATK